MDSRLPTLIKVLEQTPEKGFCEYVNCIGISCNECPFVNKASKEILVNILKTYELLED